MEERAANSRRLIVDSGERLAGLSIVVLCRNNQSFLPKLFSMLGGLEREYLCEFNYQFLENGSTDGTRALLDDFLVGRDGRVFGPTNTVELDQLGRTEKLAVLRNIAKDACPDAAQWTVLLDTDVYFGSDVLARLFAHSPSQHNVGMLCAFGTEVFPHGPAGRFTTQGHYYDTFAFVGLDERFYWPYCVFESCAKCRNVPLGERTKVGGGLLVASAFGGLAVVRTSILKDPRVAWRSFRHQSLNLCEHLGFCGSLREVSGTSVLVATDCPVYWDASTYGLAPEHVPVPAGPAA